MACAHPQPWGRLAGNVGAERAHDGQDKQRGLFPLCIHLEMGSSISKSRRHSGSLLQTDPLSAAQQQKEQSALCCALLLHAAAASQAEQPPHTMNWVYYTPYTVTVPSGTLPTFQFQD